MLSMATIAASSLITSSRFYLRQKVKALMKKLDYPTITLNDGDKRYRSVKINSKAELVYEQADVGAMTSKTAPNGGDSDYEYWVTVTATSKDIVLLKLIQQRFTDQSEFSDWLDTNEIKFDFDSY